MAAPSPRIPVAVVALSPTPLAGCILTRPPSIRHRSLLPVPSDWLGAGVAGFASQHRFLWLLTPRPYRSARCASATVLRLVHGIQGGPEQTVPRSELSAIRVALELETPRSWTIITDHLNHVEAWAKGSDHLHGTALNTV